MRRTDSSDNVRVCNFTEHNEHKNKSESPDPLIQFNYYLPNFNYINNINRTNLNNSINGNNINNNNRFINNYHPNNINNFNNGNNNINMMNNFNNINNKFRNINHVNNINSINDINISQNNSNNNLNISYNFSTNRNNIINDSMEDVYSVSKKRKDSFNSCPSLKGNHLSFNTTTDTNNNYNNVHKMNNNLNNHNHQSSFLNNNDNQNLLSMQELFLNLNPYTASLMRNNEVHMNQFLHNNNNYHFNNPNFFNHANYNDLNNFKTMSAFNINNPINEHHKKSHSTKGSHNLNGNYGFNNNNFININMNNNSIDGNMSNDNLSHSSIGSNKAQIKKKRTSLFQNGCNKEKDLRDFKRFCDGLKILMEDYICTQIGSRIMQKYLKRFPSYIRTLLINKISKYIEKLMCDTYGNYFCQKLYNISDLEQRKLILTSIKSSFVNISKNGCGAHAIQFIIGEAKSEEEKKIISECISSHELELSFDPEGTHVLQKIISCFSENEIQNLNSVLSLANNLQLLCQDAKGTCVIKKLIANTKDKSNKIKIIKGIEEHCVEIAENPYGNYIIQYVFEEWDVDTCADLVRVCICNSKAFAMQKYSSNVIVKIIDLYLNEKEFMENLKKMFFYNDENVVDLYNNKYGRLLLIKLGKVLSKEEKEKMLKESEDKDDGKRKEIIGILSELLN